MGNCAKQHSSSDLKYQQKYEQLEVQHLTLMYNDLTARGTAKGITRQQFDTFFHLNGLWGAEMFRKFDKNKEGYITFQQFLESIEIMVKGTWDQKAQILFDFYDVQKTHGITFSQLTKMIYSYPKEEITKMITEQKFLKTIDPHQLTYYFDPQKRISDKNIIDVSQSQEVSQKLVSTFFKSPEQMRKMHIQLNSPTKRNIIRKEKKQNRKTDDSDCNGEYSLKSMLINSKNLPRKGQIQRNNSLTQNKKKKHKKYKVTSNISSLVKKYAAFIFNEFKVDKNKGQLSLNQFKTLIKDNQLIFNTYFEGFHTYIWQIDESKGIPLYKQMTPYIHSDALQIFQQKTTPVYILFIKTTIFILDNRRSTRPRQIKNLQGLHIKQMQECNVKNYHNGICIYHRDGIYPEKNYIFVSRKVKEEWMMHLNDFINNNIYDEYQPIERIGTGHFSTVYYGLQKQTKKQVAIKMIEKFKLSIDQKQVIKKECSILKLCHHPHIVKFYQQYNTKSHMYIITQYLGQGDLFQYIKKNVFLQEYEAAIIFRQIAETIKYLNELGVIHRDLKPENVMVQLNKQKNMVHKVKIIDFGFALYKKELDMIPEKEKFAGTPGFVAPEILLGEDFDEAVDTFSLGIILYFMLCGYLPFYSSVYEQIIQQTKNCNISLRNAHWQNISEPAKQLVMGLLTYREERMTIAEALNSKWLEDIQKLKKYKGVNIKRRSR